MLSKAYLFGFLGTANCWERPDQFSCKCSKGRFLGGLGCDWLRNCEGVDHVCSPIWDYIFISDESDEPEEGTSKKGL